jgi:poly(A) polymerase
MKSRELIEKESSLQEWVHFYAHDHSKLILHVLAARFSEKKRTFFLEENQLRIEKLKAHIERKKINKPLVPSSYLMKYGIEPGKKLGDLLNMAEEITIEHNFAHPEETLKILRQTPIWKE